MKKNDCVKHYFLMHDGRKIIIPSSSSHYKTCKNKNAINIVNKINSDEFKDYRVCPPLPPHKGLIEWCYYTPTSKDMGICNGCQKEVPAGELNLHLKFCDEYDKGNCFLLGYNEDTMCLTVPGDDLQVVINEETQQKLSPITSPTTELESSSTASVNAPPLGKPVDLTASGSLAPPLLQDSYDYSSFHMSPLLQNTADPYMTLRTGASDAGSFAPPLLQDSYDYSSFHMSPFLQNTADPYMTLRTGASDAGGSSTIAAGSTATSSGGEATISVDVSESGFEKTTSVSSGSSSIGITDAGGSSTIAAGSTATSIGREATISVDVSESGFEKTTSVSSGSSSIGITVSTTKATNEGRVFTPMMGPPPPKKRTKTTKHPHLVIENYEVIETCKTYSEPAYVCKHHTRHSTKSTCKRRYYKRRYEPGINPCNYLVPVGKHSSNCKPTEGEYLSKELKEYKVLPERPEGKQLDVYCYVTPISKKNCILSWM